MRRVAFIPARGGSRRIPSKNLAEVGGVSLVHRAIRVAVDAGLEPHVSSDSARILAHASRIPGVQWHHRPAYISGPHAQIEDAIAHWAERVPWDECVLLQPTSPFRTAANIRECLRWLSLGADSALTVRPDTSWPFAGRPAKDGSKVYWERGEPYAIHHGFDARPRSQDVDPDVVETGAVYAFTREHWEIRMMRMWSDSAPVYTSRLEAFEIDTEEDLMMAKALAGAF